MQNLCFIFNEHQESNFFCAANQNSSKIVLGTANCINRDVLKKYFVQDSDVKEIIEAMEQQPDILEFDLVQNLPLNHQESLNNIEKSSLFIFWSQLSFQKSWFQYPLLIKKIIDSNLDSQSLLKAQIQVFQENSQIKNFSSKIKNLKKFFQNFLKNLKISKFDKIVIKLNDQDQEISLMFLQSQPSQFLNQFINKSINKFTFGLQESMWENFNFQNSSKITFCLGIENKVENYSEILKLMENQVAEKSQSLLSSQSSENEKSLNNTLILDDKFEKTHPLNLGNHKIHWKLIQEKINSKKQLNAFKMTNLKSKNQFLKNSYKKQKETLKRIKGKLKESQKELDEREGENSVLRQQLQTLKAQHQGCINQIKYWKSSWKSNKFQFAKETLEIQKKNSLNEKIHQELKNQIDQLKREREELKIDKVKLESQLVSGRKVVEEVLKKEREQNEIIKSQNKEIEKLKNLFEEERQKNKEQGHQLILLKVKIDQVNEDLENSQKNYQNEKQFFEEKNNKKKNKVKKLKSELKSKDEEIDSFKIDIALVKKDSKYLIEELQKIRKNESLLKDKIAQQESIILKLREQQNSIEVKAQRVNLEKLEAENSIKKFDEKNQEKTQKIKNLENEIKIQNLNLKESNNAINGFQQSIKLLQSQRGVLESEIKELQSHNKKINEEMSEERLKNIQKINDLKNIINVQENKIKQHEKRDQEMNWKMKELEVQRDKIHQELNRNNEKLTNRKQKVESLKKQLHETQLKLDQQKIITKEKILLINEIHRKKDQRVSVVRKKVSMVSDIKNMIRCFKNLNQIYNMSLTAVNVSNRIALRILSKFLERNQDKFSSITLMDYFVSYEDYERVFEISDQVRDLEKISHEKIHHQQYLKDTLNQTDTLIHFPHDYYGNVTDNIKQRKIVAQLASQNQKLSKMIFVSHLQAAQYHPEEYLMQMIESQSEIEEILPNAHFIFMDNIDDSNEEEVIESLEKSSKKKFISGVNSISPELRNYSWLTNLESNLFTPTPQSYDFSKSESYQKLKEIHN